MCLPTQVWESVLTAACRRQDKHLCVKEAHSTRDVFDRLAYLRPGSRNTLGTASTASGCGGSVATSCAPSHAMCTVLQHAGCQQPTDPNPKPKP
jgi:hypothetical protein